MRNLAETGLRLDVAFYTTVDPAWRAVPTEDQARLGGCCVCHDGCMGLDPDPILETGGGDFIECDVQCAWCMNGCAAPVGWPCECAALSPAP